MQGARGARRRHSRAAAPPLPHGAAKRGEAAPARILRGQSRGPAFGARAPSGQRAASPAGPGRSPATSGSGNGQGCRGPALAKPPPRAGELGPTRARFGQEGLLWAATPPGGASRAGRGRAGRLNAGGPEPVLAPKSTMSTGVPGSNCTLIKEQRARWERKHCRTAKEFVETEQRYLEQLELVATFFVAILRAKGTLKPAMLEAIFGPWESVCSASRTLVFHLERGHFALGLEGFRHQVVLYSHYAENFAQAQKTLQKQVRKNRSFARFKKLQETRPEFRGCQLEDLLPLPLQRLPQYKCLLEELVENTLPESSELEQLTGILKSVSEVFLQVQNISRFHENSCQMSRVQKLLKGQKIQLLAPGRWYLQEGWLMVVPPKGEEVQRRMFFLFSDSLLETKPCHPLHPWNSHKFACQSAYPLSQCTMAKVFGHTQSQGGLLSLSFPHKKLLLMSSDQQEFNKWHQHLEAAIRQLQIKPIAIC